MRLQQGIRSLILGLACASFLVVLGGWSDDERSSKSPVFLSNSEAHRLWNVPATKACCGDKPCCDEPCTGDDCPCKKPASTDTTPKPVLADREEGRFVPGWHSANDKAADAKPQTASDRSDVLVRSSAGNTKIVASQPAISTPTWVMHPSQAHSIKQSALASEILPPRQPGVPVRARGYQALLASTQATRHIDAETSQQVVKVSATTNERSRSARITLRFEQTPIRQAVQALASSSGMSIVLDPKLNDHPSIDRRITLSLENQTVASALKQILADSEYDFRIESDSYRVELDPRVHGVPSVSASHVSDNSPINSSSRKGEKKDQATADLLGAFEGQVKTTTIEGRPCLVIYANSVDHERIARALVQLLPADTNRPQVAEQEKSEKR